MKRREFAGALGLGLPFLSNIKENKSFNPKESKPFNLKYAPHFGMFKHSAGDNLLDQVQFMFDHGFRAMEDNEMMERPLETQKAIGAKMEKLGMEMGVFVIKYPDFFDGKTMTSGDKDRTKVFVDACKKAVETAKIVNAKWMTVVPGVYSRELPMGIQEGNVIENLKRGAEILEPHGLTMVLEPLSDNPNLFLRHADQSFAICKAVGGTACKTLYDIYHMQRNDGDLIKTIDACWDEIAYFQIGDNPGRKEPTTGEVNYQNVFKHIHSKGFNGILGMEHGNSRPGKEGEMAVIEAYRKVDIE
ncbi:MAG: hypothetical protein RIR51_342 [Bacteroidota bacterium]|jgi:hydroxypyruvate isomerase